MLVELKADANLVNEVSQRVALCRSVSCVEWDDCSVHGSSQWPSGHCPTSSGEVQGGCQCWNCTPRAVMHAITSRCSRRTGPLCTTHVTEANCRSCNAF